MPDPVGPLGTLAELLGGRVLIAFVGYGYAVDARRCDERHDVSEPHVRHLDVEIKFWNRGSKEVTVQRWKADVGQPSRHFAVRPEGAWTVPANGVRRVVKMRIYPQTPPLKIRSGQKVIFTFELSNGIPKRFGGKVDQPSGSGGWEWAPGAMLLRLGAGLLQRLGLLDPPALRPPPRS